MPGGEQNRGSHSLAHNARGSFNAYFFRLSYAPNSEIRAQNCFFPVLMLAHMLAFFRPLCSVYARFRRL